MALINTTSSINRKITKKDGLLDMRLIENFIATITNMSTFLKVTHGYDKAQIKLISKGEFEKNIK